MKLAKSQAAVKQHSEIEISLLENYEFSSSTLSSKNNRRYSKNCAKNKYVCLNEVIWPMTMNVGLKMKKDHIDMR